MNDTDNTNPDSTDRSAPVVSTTSGADGLFVHGLLNEWRRGGNASVDEDFVTRVMDTLGPAGGRRTRLWAPLALAAAALVIGGLWWLTRAPGPGLELAQVTKMSPGVQYRAPGMTQVGDLAPGDVIRNGTIVSTPEGGTACLKYLSRDLHIELAANSRLELKDATSGRLQAGRVRVRTSGLPEGDRYTLSTPQAEAIVTGTDFLFETRGDRTKLSVLEGRVELVAAGERRIVPALFQTEAVAGQPPSLPDLLDRDMFLRLVPEYRSFERLRAALEVPDLIPGKIINSVKSLEDVEWRATGVKQVNPVGYVSVVPKGQVKAENPSSRMLVMRLKQELPARSYRIDMDFQVEVANPGVPPDFSHSLLNTVDEKEHFLFQEAPRIGGRRQHHRTDVVYSTDPAGCRVADMIVFLNDQPVRWVRYRGRLSAWYSGASLRLGSAEIRKWTVRELVPSER